MNHRTFLLALVLIAVGALVVAATDEGPGRPAPRTGPALRHGPPGPHAKSHGAPPRRLSAERIEQVMEHLRARMPRMYERFCDLRRNKPRAFERAIARMDGFIRRLEEMPEDVRETVIQERRDQVDQHQLVKKYHVTVDPQRREQIRAEIHILAGRLFDAKQKLTKFRVEQLTKELEQLRKDWDARNDRRKQLIDEAVERLLD